MLRLPRTIRVVASTRPIDFRWNVDRLVQLVRDEWNEDPFSGDLFCFFSYHLDRVKLLVWDRNGFWLMEKRLERGRYERLVADAARIEITREQLVTLLAAVDAETFGFHSDFCE